MSDLISRQAAIKVIMNLPDCPNGFSDTYDKDCIIGVLEEVPSAEPDYDLDGYSSRLWKAAYERGKAEAERKKGEWIDLWDSADPYTSHSCRCSECKQKSLRPVGNFCKWCGADMRGDQNDT